MRRADRLFQLVQYLRGHRLVTAEQLAVRLEVSKRTIYRDIADLIGSGVPIEGEAGIGYMMGNGYDMPPLMFTQDEIVSLVAGARLIRAWGGEKMALAAEEALIKIQMVLPDKEKARLRNVGIHALTPFEIDDQTRQFIDKIEAAEHHRLKLEIDYCDQNSMFSNRIIKPLGLCYWGKVWTIIAWCELRDDFRMFRVDRIKSIETLGPFNHEPEQSLKTFFEKELCQPMANE